MLRFVTITRWTPETARALNERWMTVVKGTAPKPVLDAFAKIKYISQEISLSNSIAISVYEIDEKDLPETVPLSMYVQDVCTQEQYLVISMENFVKAQEVLPIGTIPKPEPWYRTK